MKLAALSLLLLGACASDDSGDTGDSNAGRCSSEEIYMVGAFEAHAASAGTVRVDNEVVGVEGFLGTKGYSLFVNSPLADNLTLGDLDVAAHPLRYVESTGNGDCTGTGVCHGFIAMAGTISVDDVAPFHAEFALSDLHETDGASSTPGAAIAGSVTGCFFAPQ